MGGKEQIHVVLKFILTAFSATSTKLCCCCCCVYKFSSAQLVPKSPSQIPVLLTISISHLTTVHLHTNIMQFTAPLKIVKFGPPHTVDYVAGGRWIQFCVISYLQNKTSISTSNERVESKLDMLILSIVVNYYYGLWMSITPITLFHDINNLHFYL